MLAPLAQHPSSWLGLQTPSPRSMPGGSKVMGRGPGHCGHSPSSLGVALGSGEVGVGLRAVGWVLPPSMLCCDCQPPAIGGGPQLHLPPTSPRENSALVWILRDSKFWNRHLLMGPAGPQVPKNDFLSSLCVLIFCAPSCSFFLLPFCLLTQLKSIDFTKKNNQALSKNKISQTSLHTGTYLFIYLFSKLHLLLVKSHLDHGSWHWTAPH